MKKELTQDDLYNLWLTKYHNTTVAELVEKEAELIKTPAWYRKYAVTQEQHDEWVAEAKALFFNHPRYKRYGRRYLERSWCMIYLNISPSIKDAKDD